MRTSTLRWSLALLLALGLVAGGSAIAGASGASAMARSSASVSGRSAAAVTLPHLALGASVVATGFDQPSGVYNAHDGSGRLFVLEQTGRVRVVRGSTVATEPYLDLRSAITTAGLEQGLEGLAFSPSFATTGRLYVSYTDPNNSVAVDRITVSDPTTDTPQIVRQTRIMTITKSTQFHNGGCMVFGADRYLYIGVGDGGPQYDAGHHAQNNKLLLGKILRIDPGERAGAAPYNGTYKIPASNPFYKKPKTYRREIWATGLRNPWRFSLDSKTGDLWIGDVGQDTWEEVDFAKAGSKGLDFGWSIWEGNHRLGKKPKTVSKKGYTFPIAEFKHPGAEAVIGGYVYRGSAYPALQGTYLLADWQLGWINGIRRTTPTGVRLAKPAVARLLQTSASISSFGEDEAHELYFTDWTGGALYRLTAGVK